MKIWEIIKKIGILLHKFFDNFAESIIEKIPESILEKLPEKNRKPVVLGFTGLVMMIVIFTASVVISSATGRKPPVNPVNATGAPIPFEDIFFPDEPDFLPALLLEREPRVWTVKDIEPFWNDPLPGNEEQWKETVMFTVDKIMENVK